jgi:hypothetical protein
MSNPVKTDVMIARLEAANARAYQQARSDETTSKSEHRDPDPALAASDKEVFRKQPSSRVKPVILAIVGIVLAASVYVALFVWKSPYSDAARTIFARWVHASNLQSAPQTSSKDVVSPQPLVSPEIEDRLQKMADALGDLRQQIEQLKMGQDLSKRNDADVAQKLTTNSDQIARDNAKVSEQLDAIMTQMARQNSAVAEQLKATQEQLADFDWSRPARPVRKHARRRPVSILAPAQKLAQVQSRLR